MCSLDSPVHLTNTNTRAADKNSLLPLSLSLSLSLSLADIPYSTQPARASERAFAGESGSMRSLRQRRAVESEKEGARTKYILCIFGGRRLGARRFLPFFRARPL